MQQQVEKRTAEWYDSLPLQLERAYDKVSSQQSGNPKPSNEPDKWDRFDVMMPVMAGACEMQRMPEMSDDGKFICGIKDIPNEAQRPCIVYSIGSADRWDFEAAIYKSTACEIHTFDCTVDSAHIPEEIQDRVMFHKVCIGNSSKSDSSNNLIFMNLKEIMDSLGHTYMTLLKADIEGYEYGMFNEILLEDDVELPEQISFELHYRVAPNSHLTWKSREKTAGEIALFAIRLYEQGYRVLSREDNRLCSHCTEFTVARFRCPKGSRSMIKNIESLQSNP
ncbi:hypothetical protein NSK_006173 [Nannochloropsis salina CCMP1776]|uniref:Methyltransferase domain-containing protein n=1 Tax=Nannochloropsis salina CCMP1776 TaxID=1027361 RepID=A0A4D9CYM3_9STRA|nr:hypothetical protein NSK_006173 [Nannochloropsis salina CCMP1776]|eukprot:TFJ82495.1 hypothetical protein NSK_006173 [Nannochloropsis salina CCMP1776]